jgi:hypothetical protein
LARWNRSFIYFSRGLNVNLWLQGFGMQKFLSQHPYAITSVIFLVLLFFGFFHLNWRREDFMFMLLLYFIVTLSIRLDDISRQLGSGREASPESDENVLSTLKEIRLALKETNHLLKKIRSALDQGPDT